MFYIHAYMVLFLASLHLRLNMQIYIFGSVFVRSMKRPVRLTDVVVLKLCLCMTYRIYTQREYLMRMQDFKITDVARTRQFR